MMTNATTTSIRNILYVSDMYVPKNDPKDSNEPKHSKLKAEDVTNIAKAPYTHVQVGSLHFNKELVLLYNDVLSRETGPVRPPDLPANDVDWKQFRDMQTGDHAKKVLVSYGGWNNAMLDWVNIEKGVEHAAQIMADFLNQQKLDGVDINFEGPWPKRKDSNLLEIVGKFAVQLRLQLGPEKLITIAPMRDNVLDQLGKIDTVAKSNGFRSWQDVISWINCQFYTYPTVDSNIPSHYTSLLTGNKSVGPIPADKLVVGLPLWDSAPTQNETHLADYQSDVAELVVDPEVQQHGGFGGVFVWRYKFTQYPANLDWAAKIVPGPIYQYRADGIEALRFQYSLIPGKGGLGWTNDGAAFWAFDKGIIDVEGAVGIYGYYSVYDSGCWRYEYYLHEEETPDWTQVGEEPLFCVFESQVPGTQPVYSYHAPPTHDYKLKRYQYSINPNLTRKGWTKDPEPAFYASTVKSGLDMGAGQLA